MDSSHLHSDISLARDLLARMTGPQRRAVLDDVPEFRALQHANRMLWLRIGQCGAGTDADVRDVYRPGVVW